MESSEAESTTGGRVRKKSQKLLEMEDFAHALGEFHDQGGAKWIVIRRPLWGHNDTPFGWPTPGWPIGRQGVGCPQGVIGGFSYY
jgi:hypothetical protein